MRPQQTQPDSQQTSARGRGRARGGGQGREGAGGVQGVNRQAGAPARKIASRLPVPGARGRPPKAQQQQRPPVVQQQQQRPPVEQPQPQLKRPPHVVPAQARVVSVKQPTSNSGAVTVGVTGAAADDEEVKKVETMYPDSYHNVQIKSNLLKNKYDALIKEKEEMEAQFLKERRKMSQEKLQMEENHKVLEELVNDASKETAEVKKKLDDAEKKVKVQEQRCATNEEVIKALNQKLVEAEVNKSKAEEMMNSLKTEASAAKLKAEQIAGIVNHLEQALDDEKRKAAKNEHDSEEVKHWKTKYEEANEKLKIATAEGSKPKQQLVMMQGKINELKNKAKDKMMEKETVIKGLKEAAKESNKKIKDLEKESRLNAKKLEVVKALEEEVTKLKNQNKIQAVEIKELHTSIESQETKARESFENHSKTIENMENSHFAEINNLNEKMKKLEYSKIEDLANQSAEHVKKMTELKSLFQKNDVELQVTRSQLEKSVADHEELRTEIANLEKDLDERDEEINLLSTKNMEMETAAKVKSEELDELKERCEETEKRLETASDQVCMFLLLISSFSCKV